MVRDGINLPSGLGILHWRSRHFTSIMWVQFVLEGTLESPILTKCLVDEETFDLSHHRDLPALLRYISEKSKSDVAGLLSKGTVNVNMNTVDFERLVSQPLAATEASDTTVTGPPDELDAASVLQLLRSQQAQMTKQQEVLLQLVTSLARNGNPRNNHVQPDVFDGRSIGASHWISTYEYACEQNGWTSDNDKIANLGNFLSTTAKKWYEFRVLQRRNDPWISWKKSFLSSFEPNLVARWDEAINLRYHGGPLTDYYFEKLRLLQLAEPRLPDSSVVALTLHGLPSELRQMAQIRGPKTSEEVLQCFSDLGIDETSSPHASDSVAPSGPRTLSVKDRPPRFHQEGRKTYRDNSWGLRTAATADDVSHVVDQINPDQTKNE